MGLRKKALAALFMFAPHLTTSGSGRMPRCWRCLKGWRKLSPSTSKQPRPCATRCALACRLLLKESSGRWQARWVLCKNFLRPGVPGLRCWALRLHLADRQVSSKTGLTDENVTFATRLSTPLLQVIEYLASRARDEPLLTATYPEDWMEIKVAVDEIGENNFVPSKAHHSGASIEVGLGLRSLVEGQKQGCCAKTVSLERYQQCGELNREWQRCSGIQLRHSVACEIGPSAPLVEGKPPAEMENRFVARSAHSRRSEHTMWSWFIFQAQTSLGALLWVPDATRPKVSSNLAQGSLMCW